MPGFSKESLKKVYTCDPRIQEILEEAIKITDFTVLCGYRGKEEQEKAFREGKSKARFGQSKHNVSPSLAVDIAPYPIDWNNRNAFYELAGVIKAVAHMKGTPIKWGGNFKSISDLPHFEVAE